jgi:methyl-accepting chemotaxis protein
LRAQLDIIFLGFLLLVSGSVAATYMAVQAQADDARLINLAGRQRMLTQKMTWLAFTQPDSPDLAISIQLFDQTLHALRDGGMTLNAMGRTVVLPPAPNPTSRAQLDRVAQTWAAFRTHLQPVNISALQIEAPLILAQLDALVSEFETHAQAKLIHLQLTIPSPILQTN